MLFLLLVRDDPPGPRPPPTDSPRHCSLRSRASPPSCGLPGLMRVMALQFFAYAVLATMMGLWAGPYLHDVHGLGPSSAATC